ncbi:MAG: GNAT family N-acetyltransferase [Planctomycetia bacterium]|nr:GNAT family N-acetyltransferase [Planctomycetia bacterium]
MSITIRPLLEVDLPAADRVLRAAFERDFSFQPALRLSERVQPGSHFVAVNSAGVVGTVGAINYGRFAYIALMGVAPQQQRGGIGRRLIEHALAELDRQGCRMALLDATDAGAALYTPFGFVDDGVACEYVGQFPSSANGDCAAIRPMQESDLAEVIAFDTPRFGADRSTLLRVLLADAAGRALVSCDSAGAVDGFLIARASVLGPWVASDLRAAERLLLAAARLPLNDVAKVFVPRSNGFAESLLAKHGFCVERRLRHMRRGGASPPGVPACLFGQTSFGLG